MPTGPALTYSASPTSSKWALDCTATSKIERLASVEAAACFMVMMTVVSSGHSTLSMFSTQEYQLESVAAMARSNVHCQSSAVTSLPSENLRPSITWKV